jgi:hypothetical protein
MKGVKEYIGSGVEGSNVLGFEVQKLLLTKSWIQKRRDRVAVGSK